jgi:hypothetical protein
MNRKNGYIISPHRPSGGDYLFGLKACTFSLVSIDSKSVTGGLDLSGETNGFLLVRLRP